MAKTCRTCEWASPRWRCAIRHRYLLGNEVMDCHEPRETPLLMDVLAEALGWLLNLHHGVSRGGTRYEVVGREWDEALQAGTQALARHQKETDDAPKD